MQPKTSKSVENMTKMMHILTLLENITKCQWDEPALTNYGGKTYTHGDLAVQIAKFHLVFREMGVQKGDKIAIAAKNSSEWSIAFLAVQTYHAVAVPILADFTPANIQTLVVHSESVVLITDKQLFRSMSLESMPRVRAVMNCEDFSLLYTPEISTQEFFAHVEEKFNEAYPNGLDPDMVHYTASEPEELVLINYTSGTSGNPKGVMIPARSIDSNITFARKKVPQQKGDTSLCMLPLGHMYGLVFEFLHTFLGGCHVYFLTKMPSPTVLLQAFAEVKPHILITVPLVIEKIIKNKVMPILEKPIFRFMQHIPGVSHLLFHVIHRGFMKALGGKVRLIPIGGAGMNPEVERIVMKAHIPVTIGYGMTECAPLIGYESPDKFVAGSCGKIIDRMEVRVASDDPHHDPGELQVRGMNVTTGYFKNEEATRRAFTEDGWFRTGDLGIIDKKGNIFIKGRSKFMILSSNGQNIYPEEIESLLNNHLSISESLVVGRKKSSSQPSPSMGRETLILVAIVTLTKEAEQKSNREELLSGILAEMNARLPYYSRLSGIEVLEGEFEHTPKHSIKRHLYK